MRVRLIAVGVLGMFVVSVACRGATEPARTPAPVYHPPIQPAAPRPVWLGCPDGRERLYQEALPIYGAYYESQSGILTSQYTLCANGTFDLEFNSGRYGTTDYLGSYSQVDSSIALNFADGDLAGPWIATARIRADTLFVDYNVVMAMADFVKGPYLRQGPP